MSDQERSGSDGGSTRVGIVSREGECAGAVFCEAAEASDCTADGRVVRPYDGENGPGADGDIAADYQAACVGVDRLVGCEACREINGLNGRRVVHDCAADGEGRGGVVAGRAGGCLQGVGVAAIKGEAADAGERSRSDVVCCRAACAHEDGVGGRGCRWLV